MCKSIFLKEVSPMQTIKGTVTKIRLLTFTSSPLVRFTVGTTNCLINRHSLSFLADVTEGMSLVAVGEWNARKQFIVRKYAVRGKTKIMMDIEQLSQQRGKAVLS
ncbi:predicted protein [Enterococcus gallinarum EG2]|jgi:hypothetical protein|nr:predicted protein [Enterococcus gallinarum EG2]